LDEAQLLRSCRDHLNGWQIPRRIFLVAEIPVNERGKTSRRQLAELFAS
jgi:acyl-CoA synthetase (AMP-forming)/AMP-acid ligase II